MVGSLVRLKVRSLPSRDSKFIAMRLILLAMRIYEDVSSRYEEALKCSRAQQKNVALHKDQKGPNYLRTVQLLYIIFQGISDN